MNILALNYPLERRLFTGVFCVLLILLLSYVYLVASTVLHVTARKNAEYSIQSESAKVAALEAAYLAKSRTLSFEEFALVEVENKAYVYLNPERTLTLYDES